MCVQVRACMRAYMYLRGAAGGRGISDNAVLTVYRAMYMRSACSCHASVAKHRGARG